jgi:hypothetical protein
MKPQLSHLTIGIEPRSRNDLVAAPHNLQAGNFAPLAVKTAGSRINAELFLCAALQTLCLNCTKGNREPPHARWRATLATLSRCERHYRR